MDCRQCIHVTGDEQHVGPIDMEPLFCTNKECPRWGRILNIWLECDWFEREGRGERDNDQV